MIKGHYYLKSLKLSLIGFLISFFILLGSSVSALNLYSTNVGSFHASQFDAGFKMIVYPNGILNTTYLGVNKNVLAFGEYDYFFRTDDGLPFISDYFPGNRNGKNYNSNQGIVNNYLFCDSITGVNISNCSVVNYSEGSGTVSNLMGKIDRFLYGTFIGSNVIGEGYQAPIFCFSSSEYSKSVCFYGCSHTNCGYGNNNGDVIGGVVPPRNLNLPSGDDWSFQDIPNNQIGNYPGITYNGGLDGPIIYTGSSELTGDYVYRVCTYGDVLNMLESQGFSNYLCYGGLDNFDLYNDSINYSVVPGSGKSLSEILAYSNAWDTPQEWFDFWNGLYKDKNNPSYLSMWSSYPAVYRTWFDLYYQYGGSIKNFDYVREYCVMKSLNVDSSTVYRGQYFKGVCETIQDQIQYGYGLYGGSGENIVGVNWNGVGNLSGKVQSSPVEFIQDFFNQAKSIIPTDFENGLLGFLPTYIITFLLALILFRFISH